LSDDLFRFMCAEKGGALCSEVIGIELVHFHLREFVFNLLIDLVVLSNLYILADY